MGINNPLSTSRSREDKPAVEYATVEVNDHVIDVWTEWSIDSDLLTAADGFQLAIGIPVDPTQDSISEFHRVRDLVAAGSTIRIYVGASGGASKRPQTLQLTGIIDTRKPDRTTQEGTRIDIEGRDLAAHLVDSDVPMNLLKQETEFLAVVREAVSPWDITVVTDGTAARDILTGKAKTTRRTELDIGEAKSFGIPASSFSRGLARKAEKSGLALDTMLGLTPDARTRRRASNNLAPGDIERLTIKEAKPQVSETVWGFLSRHARRLKLFMWMSPDGKLIISSPNYYTEPLHRCVRRFKNDPKDPNNIFRGGETQNAADRVSQVKVYGVSHGGDATRSKFVGMAFDTDLPYFRQRIVHDNTVNTQQEAADRANEILSRYKANALGIDYTMHGYGDGDHLYSIDTMMGVNDEVSDVNDNRYCVKRTFTNNKADGPRTRIKLIPPNVLVP